MLALATSSSSSLEAGGPGSGRDGSGGSSSLSGSLSMQTGFGTSTLGRLPTRLSSFRSLAKLSSSLEACGSSRDDIGCFLFFWDTTSRKARKKISCFYFKTKTALRHVVS